jgi:hypothetical protein
MKLGETPKAKKRAPESSSNRGETTLATQTLGGALNYVSAGFLNSATVPKDNHADCQSSPLKKSPPLGEAPAVLVDLRLYRSVARLQASLDRVVDLPTMNRHLAGRLNAKPYLITADFNNDNLNVVVDDDTFVFLS